MIAVETDFNVLVIANNPGDFLLVEDCLTAGFRRHGVIRAKNVADARKRLAKEKIDAVLVDFSLFEKELVPAAGNPKQIIPVIVIAEDANEKAAAKSLTSGVCDYLLKSEITPRALAKSIRHSLEKAVQQAKLIEAQETNKSLFLNSPLPKWIYDLQTLKFLDVNDSAVRKYGFSKKEFLEMSIMDIRPAEDISKV